MQHIAQGFNSDNSLYGTLGVGVGVTNRSVNKNSLIYGDEWDPVSLQFVLGSSDDPTQITNPSIYYLDFNLGLSVHQLVNEKWMYEIGASVSHINTPRESFYDNPIVNDSLNLSVENNNKVDRKYIAHATVQHLISDNILIKPEAYFIYHEGVNETLIGANMVFGTAPVKLYTGLWLRVVRDIIPVVGVEYNGYTLLFSYDINISKQHYASQYQGGFEFSLVKKFCSNKPSKRNPCKFLEF